MQYSSLDDCSDTLRDSYGFSVPPLYTDLHRSFAPIWQTEETERGERWNQWLQSFRNLDLNKSSQEDDAQLMERALADYTAGGDGGGDGDLTDSNGDTTWKTINTTSPIDLEEAELLQQLRALVQMGIPINRRAQFWSVFLNIKSKKRPHEYLRLVQAALDRETAFKKAAALASYQTITTSTTTANTSNSIFTPGITSSYRDNSSIEGESIATAVAQSNEDCFFVTPLTASSSSSSSNGGDSNNSSINTSPVTPSFTSSQTTRQKNAAATGSTSKKDQQGDEHALQHDQYEDWLPQIDKDLHRTFPDHPMMDTPGRAALRRILSAYSIRNPEVGYCQGLNFLAATFMLLFNEEDAFWCLVVVIEDLLPGYFDLKMVAPQVDGNVLAHLLRGSAPRVAQHLDNLQVDIPSATSAWFLVAFLNSLPLETCLRVWDVFFFERSAVVLFRAALALIDIYSQALLETDDSSEAYLLLQALGPMSFDSSRLVDSACIGFGHVNYAALRVLRDKYRPEILEAMESMFSCDEELQSYFQSAMKDAATANSLSRSQSFTETLAARNAVATSTTNTATASPNTTGSDLDALSTVRSLPSTRNTTPQSSAPPLASSPSPRHNNSSNSSSPYRQPSLPSSPLGPRPQHSSTKNGNTATNNIYKNTFWTPPPSSHIKDHFHHHPHQQQQDELGSSSPLLLLRRSRSAATLGSTVRRSHSSMHHYVHQRIDLHSLAAFLPDLNHPKVAALYRIAAKPSPRKKTNTTSAAIAAAAKAAALADDNDGKHADAHSSDTGGTTAVELNSSVNGNGNGSNEKSSGSDVLLLQWDSVLAQLPEEYQAALHGNSTSNGALFGNGATIDIGGLAGLIKALKHGQSANQNLASTHDDGDRDGDGGDTMKGDPTTIEDFVIKKKVLRRVTDGGALFRKKEIGQLFERTLKLHSKFTPLNNENNSNDSIIPPSPGSNTEKIEQLYRLRDELAAEVAANSRRQAAAMEASIIAVDTAEALHRQLAKIQAEIDVKMAALHELYNRISNVDFAIAAEEEEDQVECAALEASRASVEEFKDARAVQSAVVAALMTAVDGIRGGGRSSPTIGSPSGKSRIFSR